MAGPRKEPIPESAVVPLEYAGRWIAWDRHHTRIVASGPTFDAAYEAAIAAGEPDPIVGKAPPADSWFVGGMG